MADFFGGLDLFSEFDKDREAQGSFIHYDEDNSRSRIIFEDYASDSESEKEVNEEAQPKSPPHKEPSVESETENEAKQIKSEVLSDENVEGNSGDATETPESKNSKKSKDNKLTSEDEKKAAWLNAQLHAEAAEEANKKNTSNHQLIFERNKFRRYAKVLDSTRYTPDDESPAVQLLFNNNSFARKYRQQIEQFIKGLLWEEFRTSQETMSEITVKPGQPSCVDINPDLPPEKRSEHMRQKHALIGNSQFHRQFLVDFLGWPFNVAEPPRCNINWEIPMYIQLFNEVLADPANKPAKASGKPSKPKNLCWNCREPNHSVAECKMPRDPAKIASSRREFLADKQTSSGPKFSGPSRYHMDPELASKYSRFVPGEISDSLRSALGLKSSQLPQHIYKMRLYGYPPGWLAEAKQVKSGVTIFDKQGRVALITGEYLEDGELDEEGRPEESSEFDLNKIIEYPGFTVPVPPGIDDEHSKFKMPPIQEHQLKKTLMAQTPKPKKRKRTKPMDEKKAEAKKLKTDEDVSLTEEGEVSSPRVDLTEGEDTAPADVEMEGSGSSVTPNTLRSQPSVSRDYGTPIFTRENIALPDASKFSKDAQEHIPFENLPNSAGTFDKMKDLLEQIRNRNKKQSGEEDDA